MSAVADRILVITDLLLGAAHADENLAGEEEAAVRRLLSDLLGGGELPTEVARRIETFSPKGFDLAATARDFATDPPIRKRQLLELVAAVRDADEEIDFAEDQYMHDLAEALGMQKSEYADLALDYEVEELRSTLEELREGGG